MGHLLIYVSDPPFGMKCLRSPKKRHREIISIVIEPLVILADFLSISERGHVGISRYFDSVTFLSAH